MLMKDSFFVQRLTCCNRK